VLQVRVTHESPVIVHREIRPGGGVGVPRCGYVRMRYLVLVHCEKMMRVRVYILQLFNSSV
jgi:hypothetical protein